MGDRDFTFEIVHEGRVTRRRVLFGAAGAVGAAAFLAACGGDDDDAGSSDTGGGATDAPSNTSESTSGATSGTTAGTTGGTTAGTGGGAPAGGVEGIAALLGVDEASAGAGKTIPLGAVLALTGTGSFYGKTMTRGLDLGAKHIAANGGPTFEYTYLDHKSGDAAAGVQAMAELTSAGVEAKFASYVDNLGSMLSATAESKMFTLDGGGGTSIFGQGQPYFWGTRAITPNDPMPGLFEWFKETYPDLTTVGLVGWDIGEPNNTTIREDILAKIEASGLEFNGLYELVPVGGQDFSQVLPKIKANEPDLLLVSNYGQDPGSFANQAATAGLTAIRIGFEFTPDGVNASKGTYDSEGYTFAYDYFDAKNPTSPLAKTFVEEFVAEYGEDPDFYAANFYENAFVMWELMRRIWAEDPDAEITGEALDAALRENLTVVSVYGGDETTVGTYTLDETSQSVLRRQMGVFEYKDGSVTPLAFFDIDGADFRMA
jgi:branched-chain amino acid transport system substrate-binding protein